MHFIVIFKRSMYLNYIGSSQIISYFFNLVRSERLSRNRSLDQHSTITSPSTGVYHALLALPAPVCTAEVAEVILPHMLPPLVLVPPAEDELILPVPVTLEPKFPILTMPPHGGDSADTHFIH